MPLHILLTDYNPLEVYELVIRPEDDVILAPEAGTDQALLVMLFSRLFFVLGVDIVGDVRAEANLLDHLEDQEMRDPSAVGLMLLLEPEYWQLIDAAVAMFTKICQITSRNALTDDICRPCSSSGSFHKLKSGGLPVRAPPEDCRRKEVVLYHLLGLFVVDRLAWVDHIKKGHHDLKLQFRNLANSLYI